MQGCALEALPGQTANGGGVGRVLIHGQVAREALEVVVAQLDANRLAHIALALQVVGDLLTKLGEDGAQFCLVAHGVQVAFERGFPAHADRFAFHDNGRSSRPCAASCSQAPVLGPKVLTSQPRSWAARSPMVAMPWCCSFSSSLGPMPLILRQGRGQIWGCRSCSCTMAICWAC